MSETVVGKKLSMHVNILQMTGMFLLRFDIDSIPRWATVLTLIGDYPSVLLPVRLFFI